jgi:hypothetical protein
MTRLVFNPHTAYSNVGGTPVEFRYRHFNAFFVIFRENSLFASISAFAVLLLVALRLQLAFLLLLALLMLLRFSCC